MFINLSKHINIRRRKFSKTLKSLTSRKKSSSARINLNRHWNELEEIYGENSTTRRVTQFEKLVFDNEINDNSLNEALENRSTIEACLETPPPTPLKQESNNFGFSPIYVDFPEDITSSIDTSSPPPTPTSSGLPSPWDFFNFDFIATSTPNSSAR